MATQKQDDWLTRVLGIGRVADGAMGQLPDEAPQIDDEPLDMESLGLDVADLWQGAAAAFQTAVEAVDGQITELQSALRETDDAELHEIAEYGLNAITGNTRVPLMAAIREAGDGSANKLKTATPKLSQAIAAFRDRLASEPRVAACDDNPFDVPMSILATYEDALDQLEDVLRRAA